jgi:hypothetical protein
MSKYTFITCALILVLIFEISSFYLKLKDSKQHSYALKTAFSPYPTPSPFIESSISFSPDTINTNSGKSNEALIEINTQGKYPTLIQLELAYDPSVISEVSLIPGTLFTSPIILLNNIDKKTGRISYALSVPDGETSKQLLGTVAKLIFTINKNAIQNQTSFYFLPKTAIHATDTNIPLKIAYGLKIIINPLSQTASKSSFLRQPI